MKMKIAALMLVAAAAASADTITFVGALNVDGVGPYMLLDNGQSIFGTCFTHDLQIGPPWQWQADKETLADFTEPMRTKLLEAQWLNQQFAANTDWIGIHDGVWDIFGAGFSSLDALSWVNLAQANWALVNPDSFYVLVPQDRKDGPQWFLVDAPEPGTAWLFGGALTGFALLLRRRSRAA